MYQTNLSYHLTKELFDRDYRCIAKKKKITYLFYFPICPNYSCFFLELRNIITFDNT